ncbi:MAG: DUF1902 domain-containing protein [Methylocella sp.]
MGEAESRSIVVRIAHDEAAGVWFIESSDLAGLSGEAETVEALMRRIPGMIVDLVEENGFDDGASIAEVPVEIIASMHARVQLHRAA